ncbi:hypothetical protein CH338_10845 [Rhodoplanes elegans]|uniref:Autotransporter domain-containing protein n=2 Tax=Rhodoplanes elegans TaxID=29408 RepID=A0A327KL77_9BRAD|nr:autotransporter domain-containing protein [Rhodoplanes elegans]RAI38991.1 hypothetical protein CH338_10845 [Rhodoplanes elegans]
MDSRGTPRRTALLRTTALVGLSLGVASVLPAAVLLAAVISTPAMAQATGGAGWGGAGTGGAAGQAGSAGTGVGSGAGGAAGTAATPNGFNGADATSPDSQGGGGGGGYSFTATGDVTSPSTGGNGGTGGAGTEVSGSGGGGGGGGDGVRITSGSAVTVSAVVRGGTGGFGGAMGALGSYGAGGGGGAGIVMQTASGLTIRAAVSGGQGGTGGVQPYSDGAGGGGGGAGVILLQGGALGIAAAVTGGDGGLDAYYSRGNGGSGVVANAAAQVTVAGGITVAGGSSSGVGIGSGGAGLVLSGGGTLENAGIIRGGDGGTFSSAQTWGGVTGGTGNGGASGFVPYSSAPVRGGVGVIGTGLSIVNAGTIAGGTGGGVQANAIELSGSNNRLELRAGSVITGNVVVAGGGSNNVLAVGGTTASSFDVSQIGASVQYRGFDRFEKTGASAWTLTGTNTAALPWTVQQGALLVNGSLTNSTFTVDGGLLGGTGTIGTTQINAGGTLAPGNSIGTITVAGNLTFASGGIYAVEVSPTTADRTNVTGTATLAGTVQATFAPGAYVNKRYTILHADGGRGGTTFSTLTTSGIPANYAASLGYDPTNVYLDLVGVLGHGSGGLPGNAQNVANAINGYFNNGGALPPNFVSLFGLSGASLTTALSQLSGEVTAGAQQAAFQLGNQFLSVMLDPLGYGRGGFAGAGGPAGAALGYAKSPRIMGKAPASDVVAAVPLGWSVWGSAYGGANKTAGDARVGSNDVTARTGGVMAGADYRVAPGTTLGFALGGGLTGWDAANGLGSGSGDAFQAGLYGVTRPGPWYLAGALSFTQQWAKTERTAFAGDRLEGRFAPQTYGGRLETGWRYVTPTGAITPYGAVQVQRYHVPEFSEADLGGGGYALAYAGRNTDAMRSELGARVEHFTLLSDQALLALHGRLAWAHDRISDPTMTAVFQALPGSSFAVAGATPASDLALLSAGAEVRLASGWALAARFDGELASQAQTYSGTGTLRYAW